MDILQEFQRQITNLVKKGYPEKAGISTEKFVSSFAPLKQKLLEITPSEINIEEGRLPFVIVVKSELVPIDKMMQIVEYKGKNGIVNLTPHSSENYHPVTEVTIPESSVYLLVDIERGKDTLNITPNDAFEMIRTQKRSPLTIEEGMGIITHYPEFLIKNNCFSLLASRSTDKTVPAIWISEGRAKLGWCWAGNPHTWLGSASCKLRIGALESP